MTHVRDQAAFFFVPRADRETSPSLSMKYKNWLSRSTACGTSTFDSPSPDFGFWQTFPSPSIKYRYFL